jgi:hypothetical protein
MNTMLVGISLVTIVLAAGGGFVLASRLWSIVWMVTMLALALSVVPNFVSKVEEGHEGASFVLMFAVFPFGLVGAGSGATNWVVVSATGSRPVSKRQALGATLIFVSTIASCLMWAALMGL